MNNILVSVIVPVYNVEKYISKTVKSLINQDYNNIEIILVDDGSPDKSGKIIDNLALKDNRIVVIHKENGGVSSARNAGLKVAKGEYVTFVDGDDWVDVNYITYFVNLLEVSRCDIAMNKNNYTETNNLSSDEYSIVKAEKAIEWIYLGDIFVAVWNKMYRKKLFDDNKIFFNNDIWYGEGMLFNIECLQYTESVVVGGKSVYHQTFNPDSAMRKFNLESNFCGIRSLELQKRLWIKQNKRIENAWKYHKYCFNRSIIDGLVRSDMLEENKETYKECVKGLRKGIMIVFKNEKNFKKKLAWCGYFIAPFLMACRSANKFRKHANLIRGVTNNLPFAPYGILDNQFVFCN